MGKKVWLDLKVGDEAIIVSMIGEARERTTNCEVITIGRKYITVRLNGRETQKFDLWRGFGEYGNDLHTWDSYVENGLRKEYSRTIRNAVTYGGKSFDLIPLDAIQTFVKAIKESAGE